MMQVSCGETVCQCWQTLYCNVSECECLRRKELHLLSGEQDQVNWENSPLVNANTLCTITRTLHKRPSIFHNSGTQRQDTPANKTKCMLWVSVLLWNNESCSNDIRNMKIKAELDIQWKLRCQHLKVAIERQYRVTVQWMYCTETLKTHALVPAASLQCDSQKNAYGCLNTYRLSRSSSGFSKVCRLAMMSTFVCYTTAQVQRLIKTAAAPVMWHRGLECIKRVTVRAGTFVNLT